MVEVTFSPPPLGSPAHCRVFLPSRPRHFDFTDLSRFGRICLTLLREEAIYPDQADVWETHGQLFNQLTLRLKSHNFLSNKDYVVLVGDPLIQAATLYALGQLDSLSPLDVVTLLRYDGQSKSYWPFRLVRSPR